MDDVQLEKILEKLEEAVDASVRKTVNGKIDKLTHKVDGIEVKVDDHIKKHDEDMESIKPIIELHRDATGFKKTIAGISVVAGSIAGLGIAIGQIISFFSKG